MKFPRKGHHVIVINNCDNEERECSWEEFVKIINFIKGKPWIHLFLFLKHLDKIGIEFLVNFTNSMCCYSSSHKNKTQKPKNHPKKNF